MTKGRPFTDPTFQPGGRPFNDTKHPNYEKFRGWLNDLMDEVEDDIADDMEDGIEDAEDHLQGEEEGVVDEAEEIIDQTEDQADEIVDEPNEVPANDDAISDRGETPITKQITLAEEEIALLENMISGKLLTGTDTNDNIKGTNRDDIIIGGLGADKFKTKKGADTILDFEAGVDSLIVRLKDIEVSIVDGSTLIEHKKGSILLDGLELTAAEIFG